MGMRVGQTVPPAGISGSRRSSGSPLGLWLRSHLPECVFAAFVLSALAVGIADDHRLFFTDPAKSWGASEWMIDYSSGFVRRGLGGTVVKELLRLTGIGFFPFWIAAGSLSFLGLSAILLRVTSRLGGSRLWRLALLLNPLLLITACYYGTFARKDLLFVWGTLLNVALSSRLLARPRQSVFAPAALVLAVFSASAATLALLHEGLLPFVWLPMNLAVCTFALARIGLRRRILALSLVVALLPAGAATLAAVTHHGNAQMAQSICESWRFAVPLPCTKPSGIPPEIMSLGWSLSRAVALPLRFVPEFPIYPAILLLGGGLIIISVRVLIPAARLEHLIPALILPFLISLPLYVLGEDWGRWLALTTMCSLPVMLSAQVRPACYLCLPPRLRRLIDSTVPFAERGLHALRGAVQRHIALFCAALLLLEVPPIPINLLTFLNPPVTELLVRLARHFGS